MGQKVDRTCPVCGKAYVADSTRLSWGRETTCSRACSYLLRAGRLNRKTSFVCPVCGKEFERAPSEVKGKHGGQFCSRSCHYAARGLGLSKRIVTSPYTISDEARSAWLKGAKKGRATRIARNNYGHSEATRRHLSETTAKAIAEGRINRVSQLENKVAATLTALGIAHTRQRVFRDKRGRFACSVDFWLTETGMVLEVNGSFWHADPRIYPVPTSPVQIRNAAAFSRKRKHLESLGIPLAVLWEQDFERNPTEAVLAACSQPITS